MHWPGPAGEATLSPLVPAATSLGCPLDVCLNIHAEIPVSLGTCAAQGLLSSRALPQLRTVLSASGPSAAERSTALVTESVG